MTKRILIALVSTAVALTTLFLVVRNEAATTKLNDRVQLLETSIKQENLLSKKPGVVSAFLTREGIEHSEYVIDKNYPEYSRLIYARDRTSVHTFGALGPRTWEVLMEFKFDENDCLKNYKLSRVATGL